MSKRSDAGTYLIYVRQSYHRAADADVSPEAQEAAAVARLPAGASHEVIRDVGGHRSGRSDRRPGFQRLLQRIADPDVAGVAVYDLSRIARSSRLVQNLHHELERRNLELIVANMPHGFAGATGRYVEHARRRRAAPSGPRLRAHGGNHPHQARGRRT